MPAAALEAALDAAAPPSVMPWSADHPCTAPDLAHARPASSSRHARDEFLPRNFLPLLDPELRDQVSKVLEKQKKGGFPPSRQSQNPPFSR